MVYISDITNAKTGHPRLDREHLAISRQINVVADHVVNGHWAEAQAEIPKLRALADDHFVREESMMSRKKYPYAAYNEHVVAHRMFGFLLGELSAHIGSHSTSALGALADMSIHFIEMIEITDKRFLAWADRRSGASGASGAVRTAATPSVEAAERSG